MMEVHAESQRRGSTLARLRDLPLAEGRAEWARIVAAAPTDLALNARDTCGDGDQSPLAADWRGPREAYLRADLLFQMWGQGGDWWPKNVFSVFFRNSRDEDATMPPFTRACWKGELAVVRAEIARARREDASAATADAADAAATAGSSVVSSLTRLLETRCFVLRFSPLLACIDGSRQFAHFCKSGMRGPLESAVPGGWKHLEVARELIAAGARVNAKDVAGVSALAHCAFSVAGPMTLQIGAELARAGADARATDRRGSPILSSPIAQHQLETLKAVVSWGADPLQLLCPPDTNTCLGMARKRGWAEGTRVLEEAAARLADKARDAALIGQRVLIARLIAKPQLNGRAGIVECVCPTDASRFNVRLLAQKAGGAAEGDAGAATDADADADAGRIVSVKRANLDFVETVPETRERLGACVCAGDAFFRCRGCLKKFYCGVDCQTSDWPSHKAPCKASKASLAVIPLPTAEEEENGPVTLDMVQIMELGNRPSKADFLASIRAKAAARPPLGEPFCVKVQVPIQSSSDTDNVICIYDKAHSVQHSLPLSSGAPHKLLTDAVKAGPLKVKAYINAKLEEKGGRTCLVVDAGKLLPEQPW